MTDVPHSFGECFTTRFGPVVAVADERGRAMRLEFAPRGAAEIEAREQVLGWQFVCGSSPRAETREIRAQVGEYFEGERTEFTLELAPRGTAFQQLVWAALKNIPFGQTTSYGQLAAQLGKPKASRAVGLANGKNPLWLILPCHRVVGANGSLTGYAGGLSVKRALLAFEGVALNSRGVLPNAQTDTLFQT